MKLLKLIFGAFSIAASVALLLLVMNELVPIHLADTLYMIGGIGIVSALGTYILIIITE